MTGDAAPMPYARAVRFDGAMSEPELAFLYDVARSMPPGAVVVEIGSFKGRSSVATCEGLTHVPNARFVAVDPWRRKDVRTGEHIKRGGFVSGHDHSWRSVRLAAASHFPEVGVLDSILHLPKERDELPVRPHALATGAAQMAARGLARRVLRRGV